MSEMPSSNPTSSFETTLEQLQATVKRLESGELNLDQALKSFEEGVRLARACQDALTSAEQRVEILIKSNSSSEIKPFTQGRTS